MVNSKDNTSDLIDRRNVTLDDIDKTKKMFGMSGHPAIETKAHDGSWIIQAYYQEPLLITIIINKVVDKEQQKEDEKC